MTAILILADAFGSDTFNPSLLYLATLIIDVVILENWK